MTLEEETLRFFIEVQCYLHERHQGSSELRREAAELTVAAALLLLLLRSDLAIS